MTKLAVSCSGQGKGYNTRLWVGANDEFYMRFPCIHEWSLIFWITSYRGSF